jgi:hypothetical protein
VEVLDVLVQPDGRHPSRVPRLGILPCLQQRRAVHGSEREIFLRFLGQSGYEPRNRVVDQKMFFFRFGFCQIWTGSESNFNAMQFSIGKNT